VLPLLVILGHARAMACGVGLATVARREAGWSHRDQRVRCRPGRARPGYGRSASRRAGVACVSTTFRLVKSSNLGTHEPPL
jgi:hypothetical protein